MKSSVKKIIIAILSVLIVIVAVLLLFVLAPTKKATAPTKDSSAKGEDAVHEIKVVDAVNYKRDVIFVHPEYNVGNDIEHIIIIPKLEATVESNSLKAFNDKIYSALSEPYDKLTANAEGDKLYDIQYKSKTYNDIIGIMVFYTVGIQNSEYDTDIYCYYYDTKNDKELSMDEYFAALGTSEEAVFNKFKQTSDYAEIGYDADANQTVFECCILDENSAIIQISNDTFPMSPTAYYEYDYSFIK